MALSSKLNAGIITNVISYIEDSSNVCVKKQSFSSKAIETVRLKSKIGVLAISPNAFEIKNDSVDFEVEIKSHISSLMLKLLVKILIKVKFHYLKQKLLSLQEEA